MAIGKNKESWNQQVIRRIEEAPLVIFDGRHTNQATRWELSYVLTSSHLAKLIIVGPVDDRSIAEFLRAFDGVPVVDARVLIDVVRAAASSRERLLQWYDRRRHSILSALRRAKRPRQSQAAFAPNWAAFYVPHFYEQVPRLIELHERETLQGARALTGSDDF